MEPLVSIIIPNYNRAHLISETLDSILMQSYRYWECIIVDDESTDHSDSVIDSYCKKDARISFYNRPDHLAKGANTCRNYGLKLSKGEYINWFDSDDIMHPDKLKLQIEALIYSNKPFCVCQSYVFEHTIQNPLGLKSQFIISDHPFEDFLMKKNVWLTQVPLFKRKFLIENNFYFDEKLLAGQEWELFTRILFICEDYIAIKTPLVYIRKHSNSISGLSISPHQSWNYFLARFKIYTLLKNDLSIGSISYLKRYFLSMYKQFLRRHAFKEAFQVWKMTLFFDKTYTVKQHFFLILSFFSFYIFRKGDAFLTKVHRWD